ncbi:MAG: bifunctional methionine sulfoxide reductase B/A protein [Bacteroidota bacterium]
MLKWIDIIKFAKNGNPNPDRVVTKTDEEWRAMLSPEQFQVTRKKGTERAFSSEMCGLFEPGLYACACCGTLLFDAQEKFESGTGWPSFTQPIKVNAIAYHLDNTFGMQRVETVCNTCEAHLGHVFPDGPPPGGLRYCMNAVSLEKSKNAKLLEEATFGGGCFWCMEAVFERLIGVESVVSGYSGGLVPDPSYKAVTTGLTGHAEVVQIRFDPLQISYSDLLRIFFQLHNPTTRDRQGPDVGSQYRSAVFYHDFSQRDTAYSIIEETRSRYTQPIVTQVVPFVEFYPAEEAHQHYFQNHAENVYCQKVIVPKMEMLEAMFPAILKVK